MRTQLCRRCFALVLFFAATAAFCQIPGENVNMVSGTKWPGGDPFLQRQNEPSLAVSTRNPLHLLAGANDYRSVDLELAESLPDDLDAGDAWLGMFKSFDGGRSWQSTLLPGYPQDHSTLGLASPLHGYTTASDPTVRAGTNGMFYYSGIAFNRGSNLGEVFVARFSDFNNKENGDATQLQDAIRYIGATQIQSGTAGQFLDKPWIATDIPRGGGTCNIQTQQSDGSFVTQTFAAGNVYIVYSVFLGKGNNQHSKIVLRRSSDCGASWGPPVNVGESYALSQGATIAIDPQTGAVYVAWRTFRARNQPNQIVVAKSFDFGNSFTQGVPVVSLPPYDPANPAAPSFLDQGTTATSFRTNAFPTIAVDDSGSVGAPGRVYVAWSQRGVGISGDARIVLSTSMDGIAWSAPVPIDNQPFVDDAGNSFGRGHQIMPEITFIGGKLMATYYDLRLDHTVGMFEPNSPFVADSKGEFYKEKRDLFGELLSDPSRVFTSFVDDAGLTQRRHTLDVMVAQSDGGPAPTFTTARASQYKIGIRGDATGNDTQLEELQVNPPNLPLFAQGSEPFIGDYIDIAGQMYVPVNGRWVFNNPASGGNPANSAVDYAVWTSDQDVRAPQDGNWKHYTPVGFGSGRQSTFDPTQKIPDCVSGQEGMRNQNIYESRITQGLMISSPQNTKPLNMSFQRGFVVLVQNFMGTQKTFRLTISAPAGVFASFQQILPNPTAPPAVFPAPLISVDVTVAAHSGAARTVFAMLENGGVGASPAITVNANEIDAPGAASPTANGLSSFVVLNGDVSTPPLISADASTNVATQEVYDAGISDPNVTNPNVTNPNVTNPNVTNPNVTNPNVTNPNVTNPDLANPNVTNPNVTNSNIVNPNVTNPNVTNSNIGDAPVADATYQITNKGNTTASYRVRLAGQTSTPLQLLLTKTYTTPVGVNCQLMEESQQTVQTNVGTAAFDDFQTLSDPNVTNPNVTNATIALSPGETALVTLRGQNITTSQMSDIVQHEVAPVVVPQAVNTTNTTATAPPVAAPPIPVITTAVLPDATAGAPAYTVQPYYSVQLQAVGGAAPYSWSAMNLPPGFSVNMASGLVSNSNPSANIPGVFNVTAQLVDLDGKTATRSLTLRVLAAPTISADSGPYTSTAQASESGWAYDNVYGGCFIVCWVSGTNDASSGVSSGSGSSPFDLRLSAPSLPTGAVLLSATLNVSTTLSNQSATYNLTTCSPSFNGISGQPTCDSFASNVTGSSTEFSSLTSSAGTTSLPAAPGTQNIDLLALGLGNTLMAGGILDVAGSTSVSGNGYATFENPNCGIYSDNFNNQRDCRGGGYGYGDYVAGNTYQTVSYNNDAVLTEYYWIPPAAPIP